jgi:hypothetical protein
MDFAFAPEEEAFRQEVRSFLQEELRDRASGGLEAWQRHDRRFSPPSSSRRLSGLWAARRLGVGRRGREP